MAELAHLNRQTTAGELSASIAHELNQPLGAILSNTETVELMLETPSPNLEEIKTILTDIKRADQRATEDSACAVFSPRPKSTRGISI